MKRCKWILMFLLCLAPYLVHADPDGIPAHVQHKYLEVNNANDIVADDGSCTLREAIEIAVGKNLRSGNSEGECRKGGASMDTIYLRAPARTYKIDVARNGYIKIKNDVFLFNEADVAVTLDFGRASHPFEFFNGSTLKIGDNISIKGGGLSGATKNNSSLF